MSEVECWGGDSVGQDMGVQGRAGHVGWPQAGGKDMAELLQDSQGPWGTGPCWGAGPMGAGPHWDTGPAGPHWNAGCCTDGNWSPHWDAELMAS